MLEHLNEPIMELDPVHQLCVGMIMKYIFRLRHKGEFKKIKENTPLEQEEFTA